jgi:hypothetical protein
MGPADGPIEQVPRGVFVIAPARCFPLCAAWPKRRGWEECENLQEASGAAGAYKGF